MDSRPLIQDSLRILSLVGLNPFSSNLLNCIFGICAASISMGVTIDVGLVLAFTYQGIDSTMEVLSFVAITQIAVKILFLLANKMEIRILVNNTNRFWKPNSDDFEQQEKNEKIFSFVKSCIRSYIVLLLLICLLYFIRPLFFAEIIELPWKSICSKFWKYKVCFVIEIPETVILVLIQVGFDSMYISFIANIICEFKLIEKHFPNLKINPMVNGTDKDAMDQLRRLIDHHNLILECTKIMKHMYRVPLLGLFLLNMFALCFCMVIMTIGNADTITKLQFGMLMIFYLIQLLLYCISGSLLADESMKISYQVYKSQWWIKTQPELRKALLMVIRRSNKPEILTAGGLIQVNLQTFRMILKSSVSFFTFMQAIYGN